MFRKGLELMSWNGFDFVSEADDLDFRVNEAGEVEMPNGCTITGFSLNNITQPNSRNYNKVFKSFKQALKEACKRIESHRFYTYEIVMYFTNEHDYGCEVRVCNVTKNMSGTICVSMIEDETIMIPVPSTLYVQKNVIGVRVAL